MIRLAPPALLVWVAGCASAQPPRARPEPPADLAPALPTAASGVASGAGAGAEYDPTCPPRRCAPTGTPARLVLDPQREQVRELYVRYVRALYDQSVGELRPLFGDFVGGIDGAAPAVSREALLSIYERVVQSIDPAAQPFAAVLDERGPDLHTLAELRALRVSAPRALRPGDWLVEGNPRFARRMMPAMPLLGLVGRFVVRWEGDRPVIVALRDDLLGTRFR